MKRCIAALPLVLLVVSSGIVSAAAPLDQLVIRHSDLRSSYSAPFTFTPGYSHQAFIENDYHLGRAAYARHGYLISYQASWADPGSPPKPQLTVAAVEEAADRYSTTSGAHWEFTLAQRRGRYGPAGGLHGRRISMPVVGNESAAYYWLPPETPFPAVTILFHRGNYFIAVSGFGRASGLTWPSNQTVPPRGGPVLGLARLVDSRLRARG